MKGGKAVVTTARGHHRRSAVYISPTVSLISVSGPGYLYNYLKDVNRTVDTLGWHPIVGGHPKPRRLTDEELSRMAFDGHFILMLFSHTKTRIPAVARRRRKLLEIVRL